MPIITVDPAKKAEIDRIAAVRAADAWFAGEVAKGYETQYGWKLGLAESDVTLLTGQFVLAKEAAAADLPLPPVIDVDGVVHDLTLAELTALMLGYGAHRATLSSEYAARKATVVEG